MQKIQMHLLKKVVILNFIHNFATKSIGDIKHNMKIMKNKVKEHFLISELKNNSTKAFNEIYNMYSKKLLAYSFQYTKSYETAEDIVQDVFVKLWNMRHFIKQEETLHSLLFTISKHYLINAYRKNINSPIYEDYIDHINDISIENTSSPIEYDEYLSIINKQLEKLSTTQQKVIRLSKFSCLSNKEIAEILSLSEQTVKNQLSIGLKELRILLKGKIISILLVLNIINTFS